MTRSRAHGTVRVTSIGIVSVALLSLSAFGSTSSHTAAALQASTRPSCPAPGPASAATPSTGLPGLTEGKTYSLYSPMPTYPWEGSFESHNVTVKSQRTGVPLDATLFSPVGTIKPCSLPAVVIIPGSVVGVQTQVQWAARDLAGHGYVSLTIDPMGQGHSPEVPLPSCNGTPVKPSASPDGFGSNPPVTLSGHQVNWPTTTGHVPCDNEPADSSGLNYLDGLESGIDWLLSSADPVVGKVNPSEVGVAGHSLGAIVVSAAQAIDHRI